MLDLAAALEAGRRDFLEAANGAPVGSSRRGSAWSVLECIEHVIKVEDRFIALVVNGEPTPPQCDPDKELRVFTTVRSRLTKIEAPERFRPRGRFNTLEAALAKFNATRDRSVALARERGANLYAIRAKHPFFGNLNGVEFIQLIDGHARRHADQIREIPAMNSPDRPDLPADLEPGATPADVIQDQHLIDCSWPKLQLDTMRVEGSVLERVHLAESRFGSLTLKDVRLQGCDLANVRAHRLTLLRAELIECRLTGLRSDALDWRHVRIQNSDLSYVQMQAGKFQNCAFDGCKFREADLKEANLAGALFRGCSLTGADLNRAKLRNADFRSSELEGMLIGRDDLEGAIVDPAQAMVLAKLLGIQIR